MKRRTRTFRSLRINCKEISTGRKTAEWHILSFISRIIHLLYRVSQVGNGHYNFPEKRTTGDGKEFTGKLDFPRYENHSCENTYALNEPGAEGAEVAGKTPGNRKYNVLYKCSLGG